MSNGEYSPMSLLSFSTIRCLKMAVLSYMYTYHLLGTSFSMHVVVNFNSTGKLFHATITLGTYDELK